MAKEQVHGGDVYRHPGVIDFSSNMNPLGTPKAVVEAACESMQRICNYPDIRCSELTEALSKSLCVPQEQIICGNGAADVIFSLVQAMKPVKALLQAPTFAEYRQALESVNCQVEMFDTNPHGFAVTKSFVDAVNETHDVVFLCNPNNPTGFPVAQEVLLQLLEKCRKLNVRLVIDECFLDFLPDQEERTLIGELEANPQLFILRAFTKRYAMAGLRLGYGLCADRELLSRMEQITQPWNVSVPAQAAGVAALALTDYVADGNRIVAEELTYLKRTMAEMGLTVFDSKANYVFFKGPEDLMEHCLKGGCLIRSCANYPGLDGSYFRIAVKNHEDNRKPMELLQSHPLLHS